MTDIGFYHLTRTPLERALPKLLEKVIAAGKRAIVRTGSEERIEFLDGALWTYEPSSFLAHGAARDGGAEDQPIWLTTGNDKPNGAQILILTDGVMAPDLEEFERCFEMFDGRDQAAVEAARTRWRDYTVSGHTLTYWQQNERGGWEQKSGG